MEKLLEAQATLEKALSLISEVIRELIEEQNMIAEKYKGNLDDETVED